MAEHSTVGSTQPNSSTTSSASSKTGGGGGLHSNKSLDMTSASSAGGGGGKSSSKHSNVIHRTTSESLRLGGAAGAGGGGGDSSGGSGTPSASLMNSSSAASINSVSRKAASVAGGGGGGKPSSSFMITSVTVGARTSADNGDDSADDLDESHTDDNSRITDFENETPSFSEDTFSKEDVFFAANALGNVPVIPTSSQYGLAIVAPTDRGHGSEGLSDAMHVSVTDAGINIMGHSKEDGKDSHHRNERFKVVKIESTEPFKRGRWVCMDYLDHTTLQASPKESGTSEGGETSTASTIVDSNAIRTQDSGVVLNDNSYGTTGPSEGDNADYHTHLAAASAATNPVVGMLNNESPGQSLNLAQPTTSQQQQQQQASHAQTAAAAATVPHSLPQTQLANALAGAQAPQPAAIPPQQPQPQYYPHTMSNLADITQQQPAGGHQHGVTLPTSIQMQPQPQQPSNNPATVLPAAAPAAVATSQEMNIVVSNTQQMSFPSPQQFQQQQQPSQTNSPVVATGGNEQDPAAVLSPSSSVAAPPAPTPSQPLDSAPPTTEPLVSASPAATSSPITATAEPSASTNSAPSMAAAVAAAVGSPSTSASSHATIAAAAAAAAATAVTSDHLTESNLLSAVAGVTAAAVAAAGGGDGEGDKTGEDGESLGRIQPVTDPTTTVPSSASTTTPVPAIPERTLTTSSLQQHLQQNIPLDRSRIPSSSASSVSSVSVNRNNTFTDLALGRTIQDLMRPGVAGGQPTSSTTAAAGGEVLCRTACNLLNNGAHSIATCTTTYPHRCVQDLIKEEMGGGSRTPGTLSQAGSLVNIHIESELQQHAATGGGGGFQSHPNSGRSSPAHTMFHHGGSPPKHLSAIGHSMSIPSSTRVSRAPSPSFLHAAVAEHSSASGTSAVAIDNKIEQAMDLVKSHLMFAVREEVEVLKEKISELMDRINQLEYENNILKQNASQETLSQLTPSGTPSAAQSAQTTAGAAAASVAAALTPLAKSQAAAAASASSAAAAAGTPTVNPNANGSVS